MQDTALVIDSPNDHHRRQLRGRSREFAIAGAAGHVGAMVRTVPDDRAYNRAARRRACGPRASSQAQHRREPNDRVAFQRSKHPDAANPQGWQGDRSDCRSAAQTRDSAQAGVCHRLKHLCPLRSTAGGARKRRHWKATSRVASRSLENTNRTRTPAMVTIKAFRRAGSVVVRLGLRATLVLAVLNLGQAVSAQEPPKETGAFRKPDLVEINKLDPSIKLDIRYATS